MMSAYAPRWAEVHTLCRGINTCEDVDQYRWAPAIARAWERNETARRRGLTTNGVSRLDAPFGDVHPEDDVAAVSLLV
jgi:hypothetical protein